LADAIASVLAQSFPDFEFVIVDDGSKDRTAQILEHFARRDGRIALLRKEHTGLADSLNFGIERARGKWIARIDADDLCNQQRLERQLAYVRTHQDVVFWERAVWRLTRKERSERFIAIQATIVASFEDCSDD
jgi:glycosyltransferase involved in cell wall biosynthesis